MKKQPQQYLQQIEQHLNALKGINEEIYNQAIEILNDQQNYVVPIDQWQDIRKDAQCIAKLTSKTGENPHHHLSSLVDLTDEDQILLWPLTQLNKSAKRELANLFKISTQIFEMVGDS